MTGSTPAGNIGGMATTLSATSQAGTRNNGRHPGGGLDRRWFLLQRAQPALTGLIDGSLSTLAPLFAVAFATRQPHYAFLAGLATARRRRQHGLLRGPVRHRGPDWTRQPLPAREDHRDGHLPRRHP